MFPPPPPVPPGLGGPPAPTTTVQGAQAPAGERAAAPIWSPGKPAQAPAASGPEAAPAKPAGSLGMLLGAAALFAAGWWVGRKKPAKKDPDAS